LQNFPILGGENKRGLQKINLRGVGIYTHEIQLLSGRSRWIYRLKDVKMSNAKFGVAWLDMARNDVVAVI
jgi:hypothetical protein